MTGFRRAVGLVGLAGWLAACGGGGGNSGPANTGMDPTDAAMMMPPGTVATPTPDAAQPLKALRVVSEALDSVVVGETFRYRAQASDQAARFEAISLPTGATLDGAGNFSWSPTAEQGGVHKLSLRALSGTDVAVQEFEVTVASLHPQRTAEVDPTLSTTTTITVDAPLSPIRGAGVQIDPGSMVAEGKVQISISMMENAPVPPVAKIAGIAANLLTPIELGPSGTAFRKPARVQLPATAELFKLGQPAVVTMDPDTGAWERVKVLAVDQVQGLVTAEIQHFSTYVVVPSVDIMKAELVKGGAGTGCAESLIVRAALAMSPAALPAGSVNGYSGSATDFAGVLASMSPGQAIQSLIHVSANSAGASEEGWLLVAAAKDQTGNFNVVVRSHRQATPILAKNNLGPTDATLLSLLGGGKANFIFGGLGDLSAGASATIDISFYLVDAADAAYAPVNAVNPVARETISASVLTADVAGPGYDTDCDQTPDVDDAEPNGDPLPRLAGMPASPVHVFVGETAKLSIAADVPNVTYVWSQSDPSLGLASAMSTEAAVMPSKPGVFQVYVLGTRGKAQSRFAWEIVVNEVAVKATNTPPEVQIAATQAVARVGETVNLLALGRDREQVDLQYRWLASEAGVLSAAAGQRISFSASAPGDYKITCIGSDGVADSAPATVVLTVLAEKTNRPPEAPVVTPLSALVTHAVGEQVTVSLQASSKDPDGDPVTFDFVPDPSVSRAVTLIKSGATAQVRTLVDGAFVFHVTAQDSNGASSPETLVRIQVLPPAAISKTAADSDGDGYPEGADCNDSSAKVFPGAVEVCGDGVDQDCDGRDLGVSDCDADGDRFTISQGDCDDRDRGRNPGMPERCDGVDNNCNAQTDDGFEIGKACAGGLGACRAEGKTKCSATFVTVVCDAMPGKPAPETCDMIDNDCNGRVDDVMAAGTGTTANCGSCGVVCPSPAGATPLCIAGGCVARCQPGFIDLDRQPGNGCECAISNNGVEICDGRDNNCNGQVDDSITAASYSASFVTLGVGVCSGGAKVCKNGMLVDERPATVPSPETCDGLDNDCNGIVDDTFNFTADPRNCGACGIVCPATARCDGGKCVGGSWDGGVPPPPGSGTTPAARIAFCPQANGVTTCVNLLYDSAHCGECNRVCPSGTVCLNTSCTAKEKLPADFMPPPPGSFQCPPPGGADAGYNYDGPPGTGGPRTDAGQPYPPMCSAPLKLCPDAAGGSYCTDPGRDSRNCGTCGLVCQQGQYCDFGKCVAVGTGSGGGFVDGGAPTPGTCPPEGATCPGRNGEKICTRLDYDPMNCGACGIVCPPGQGCNLRKCEPFPDGGVAGTPGTCPPDMATCPGRNGEKFCTKLDYDPMNCGACGIVCPADMFCNNRKCEGRPDGGAGPTGPYTGDGGVLSCPTGMQSCSPKPGFSFCADVNYDRNNCGGCNNICPSDMFCMQGKCVPPPAGFDGGAPMTCPPDLKACPMATGGLYCANPIWDRNHCGGCGITCSPEQICNNGQCTVPMSFDGGPPPSCPPEAIFCPDAAGNKVCTKIDFDAKNCGGCGKVCPDGQFCSKGLCAPPV